MQIGSIIKKLRKQQKITQLELAKALNIADNTVSQYENGQRLPSDEIKIKLADYFGVSLDYLMGREEDFDGLNIVKKPLETKTEVQTIYDSLTPRQQQRVLAYMYGFSDANKDFEKLQKKS